MKTTGERYIPEAMSAEISTEHWHRYLLAADYAKNKKVLDIASGEGYGSDFLAKNAITVLGIDIDEEAVLHAKTKYKKTNLTFQQGSCTDFKTKEKFDLITSFETIEHISYDDQKKFLKEIRNHLNPGGICIISTPNKTTYSEKNNSHNPFHIHEFSTEEFKKFLFEYFPSVMLAGQRFYTGSYVWPLEKEEKQLDTFYIHSQTGTLAPQETQKEVVYVFALCSDTPIYHPISSVLLDIDDRAIEGREERLRKFNRLVEFLQKNIAGRALLSAYQSLKRLGRLF